MRLLGAQVGLDLGAPAPRSAFEDVLVMEQPIEGRGDGSGVAEQLPQSSTGRLEVKGVDRLWAEQLLADRSRTAGNLVADATVSARDWQ